MNDILFWVTVLYYVVMLSPVITVGLVAAWTSHEIGLWSFPTFRHQKPRYKALWWPGDKFLTFEMKAFWEWTGA